MIAPTNPKNASAAHKASLDVWGWRRDRRRWSFISAVNACLNNLSIPMKNLFLLLPLLLVLPARASTLTNVTLVWSPPPNLVFTITNGTEMSLATLHLGTLFRIGSGP